METTLENSLAVSSKVKFIIRLLSGTYSQEVKTVRTKNWMQLFIAALIHNSPKLEAIHMSIIWRIDKENVE